MTCKDCMHHDKCIFTDDVPLHDEDVSVTCGCFADKARFIELPCKVGDIVYCIFDEKVLPALVLDFYTDKVGTLAGLKISLDGGSPNALSSVHHIDHDSFTAADIYITKEEAEKVLKEREEK